MVLTLGIAFGCPPLSMVSKLELSLKLIEQVKPGDAALPLHHASSTPEPSVSKSVQFCGVE